MRTARARLLLTTCLCAGALLGAGCRKNGAPQASGPVSAGVPATVQPSQNVQGSAPASRNELQPPPQSVAPPDRTANPDLTPDELAAQKRDLEQRQAVLDERERQLDEREQKQATAAAAPAPAPDPAPRPSAPEPDEPRPAPARPAVPAVVTVPSGTHLAVELERGLSSRTSRPGERFRARVTAPVTVRGEVAIPAGSEVVGEVTRAGGTRRIGGQQVLAARFTALVVPHGPTLPIRASFSELGRNKAGRDTAIIGGSAAGGAVIGHNVGGNRDRGTLVGGLLGAALGSAIAAHTPGREVALPRGTVVRVRLARAVSVRTR